MTDIISSKNDDNEKKPDRIEDQGGFFDTVVRPMFQPGHEGELYSWLKEMSLIRTSLTCPQPECLGRHLSWQAARIVDRYIWKCSDCKKKVALRDGSFFLGVKCDLKIALQVILAWCQDIFYQDAASMLNIKEFIVKKVYERCAKVANTFVQDHPEEFILGGKQEVLLVDEFPGGLMLPDGIDTAKRKKRNNNSHTIICVAEANHIPTRMWFHLIQAIPEPIMKIEDGQDIKKKDPVVEEALREIKKHTLPGSLLVANNRARSCSYDCLASDKSLLTFCVDDLEQYDTNEAKTLRQNLETIWESAVIICEEIQDVKQIKCQETISVFLWRQKFGDVNSVFQYMLHHIAEVYRFT